MLTIEGKGCLDHFDPPRLEPLEGMRVLGVDRTQPARDLARGAALAALVGGVGLVGYLVAHSAGVNLTVIAQDLPDTWWRWPVLIAAAVENSLLEEIVVDRLDLD
mgnify:CR=1 FL=1